MTFPTWQHFRAATAKIEDDQVLRVKCGLHYLQGNRRPYFTVTGEIYKGHREIAGGCLHREIAAVYPRLAPIIALHLSDDNGTPMHAAANSWYQLAGYFGGAGERYHAGNGKSQHWLPDGTFNGYRPSTPEECLQAFAAYVRISVDDARAYAEAIRYEHDWKIARHLFDAWIVSQAERWQQEANAAIALLDADNLFSCEVL